MEAISTDAPQLLEFNPSLQAVQSRKSKVPKKKPQTVTGKATAQFIVVEPETPRLPQYFENGNETVHVDDSKAQISGAGTVRKKSNSKKLTQTISAKSKTNYKPVSVLQSPKTAMKFANEQELIFGTSSQLAREESPTLIKDIQQAIKASQSMSEERIIPLTERNTPSISFNQPERASMTPLAASKKMWSVASRGLDGSLLTVEVIDLIDTTKAMKKQPSNMGCEPCKRRSIENENSDTVEAGSSLAQSPYVDELHLSRKLLEANKNDVAVEQTIPRSLAEASLRNRRQSRSPVKKQKISKSSDVPPSEPILNDMPNYHGFTTADLSKEVASFGFKAIKRRPEMIALLERCWESQARIALQTLQSNVTVSNPVAPRPQEDGIGQSKVPKRKGKLSGSTTAEAASNIIPSPRKPRGRPRKPPTTSPPRPSLLDPLLASSHALEIPCTASSSKINLHSQISNAVKAAPATHSRTHPTFRERILLYDPIVLEDLCAWLNTEGLGMVGTDEEVGVGTVKEWCEKESVCCFSRDEGWRARR